MRGALAARYSHGDRTDQPLTMERGGQSYHYHDDFLGSIRKLTDGGGSGFITDKQGEATSCYPSELEEEQRAEEEYERLMEGVA